MCSIALARGACWKGAGQKERHRKQARATLLTAKKSMRLDIQHYSMVFMVAHKNPIEKVYMAWDDFSVGEIGLSLV